VLVAGAHVAHAWLVCAQAAAGERFVLQGGDCAERFQDCDKESIEGN